MLKTLGLGIGCLALLTACDSFEPIDFDDNANCQSGDIAVPSAQSCLMDDAACYQRADGQWCTGPRPSDGTF